MSSSLLNRGSEQVLCLSNQLLAALGERVSCPVVPERRLELVGWWIHECACRFTRALLSRSAVQPKVVRAPRYQGKRVCAENRKGASGYGCCQFCVGVPGVVYLPAELVPSVCECKKKKKKKRKKGKNLEEEELDITRLLELLLHSGRLSVVGCVSVGVLVPSECVATPSASQTRKPACMWLCV